MAKIAEPEVGGGARVDGVLWARLENGLWFTPHQATTWAKATRHAVTIDPLNDKEESAYKQLGDLLFAEWTGVCGPYREHGCVQCVMYQNELTELDFPYFLDSDEYVD